MDAGEKDFSPKAADKVLPKQQVPGSAAAGLAQELCKAPSGPAQRRGSKENSLMIIIEPSKCSPVNKPSSPSATACQSPAGKPAGRKRKVGGQPSKAVKRRKLAEELPLREASLPAGKSSKAGEERSIVPQLNKQPQQVRARASQSKTGSGGNVVNSNKPQSLEQRRKSVASVKLTIWANQDFEVEIID